MVMETWLLSLSILVVISILIAKFSNNIGFPVMLLFLAVGMLAGSEGPGGLYFDDPFISQWVGIVALIFILFTGGLETKWKDVKPVLVPSLSLATLGVLMTAVLVAVFTIYVFHIDWKIGLLLGAIVSSTDAAAVFSIIGARDIRLKGNVQPLLEMESGSNDPMAVFLTITLVEWITGKHLHWSSLLLDFVLEMGLGLAMGLLLGRLFLWMLHKLTFQIDAFYLVISLAFSIFIYAITAKLHGSGFFAVYVAGLVIGNEQFVHRKSILRFFDGIAWLSQISMFLTLGLLVFPSQVFSGVKIELAIALFLIFIARPVSVFASLIRSGYSIKEKLFISWVGLRGAVPIILATFPMLAGIQEANWIFNVVFFIVLTSALLQGWPIPWLAAKMGISAPNERKIKSPIEFSDFAESPMKMADFQVSSRLDMFVGKSLVQIPELKGALVVMVLRNEHYFVPSGGTVLEKEDKIQVLANEEKLKELEVLLKG
jgi:cell volume regulation protein A